MMFGELEANWKDAAKAHNERVQGEQRGTILYGKVPAELKPWENEFLQRLYSRDEFDKMCGGHDRHEKFAAWAAQNYHNWSRATDREVQALYDRCTNAAEGYKLPSTLEVR